MKRLTFEKQAHIITADLTMAQYFAALLVLCLSVNSLATTTKPQVQQKTSTWKDLCEVSTKAQRLT